MSLILVFNKNSPQAHTESELGVLGVHGKLVKYVVHSSKRKNWKILFFFTQVAQTAIDQFWSQGILGVKHGLIYYHVCCMYTKYNLMKSSPYSC
jgi:hypothetical protein